MNIVHINSLLHSGGAAQVMLSLHKSLRTTIYGSKIITRFNSSDPDIFSIFNIAYPKNSVFRRLQQRAFVELDRSFHTPKLFSSRTKDLLQSKIIQDADLIHLHNIHGHYINYQFLPNITRDKPVVWSLHDMWAFTGHCVNSFSCNRWEKGCHDCPLFDEVGKGLVFPRATIFDRTRIIWNQKKKIYNQVKNFSVVSPSNWLHQMAQRSILAPKPFFYHIPNGIDTDLFMPMDKNLSRRKLGIPNDAKVVIFVAASINGRAKGFSYLQSALQTLDEKSESVWLISAGNKNGEINVPKLRQKHFGYISDTKDLCTIYSAGDLFISTSLAESFGLVFVEAMACGTPVIGFNVGGIPEIIRHMETGYLANYQDVEDLVRGIRLLFADSARLKEMQTRCRTIAEKEYSLDKMTERYIEVYEETLKRHLSRKSIQ